MLTWSSPTDNKSNPPLCRITRCVLFGKRIVWNITDPEEERAQVLSEWLNSCFKCLTVFLFQADPFMCHSDTWNTHVFFFLNQNKAYCHRTAMHYGLFPLSSVWRVAKLRQWPVRVQTVKACRALKQSAHSPHALQMYVDLENEETKRHDGKKKYFLRCLQIICHPWTALTWLVCRLSLWWNRSARTQADRCNKMWRLDRHGAPTPWPRL